MLSEKIEVSVIVISYNHADVLQRTLDSILNQETSFGFEVLVHDDCSTDSTPTILHTYAQRYPHQFFPFIEKENQYANGLDYFHMMAEKSKGKYLAFCEGDDYWTDMEKLQLQYEAMESHPNVDLCASAAIMVTRDTYKQTGMIRPKKESGVISLEDVIYGGGQYFATTTLFFRKEEYFRQCYCFENVISCDYTMQIKGSLRGGAYYIDRPMGAYVTRIPDSWKDIEKSRPEYEKGNFYQKLVEMLHSFDKDTQGKYHDVVERRLKISAHAEVPFYEQLCNRGNTLLSHLSEASSIYLWGNGKRGDALQQFCIDHGIPLAGVCDQAESNIGESTRYGFEIVSTDTAKNSHGIIIASNDSIYHEIAEENSSYMLLNLQEYIPWS